MGVSLKKNPHFYKSNKKCPVDFFVLSLWILWKNEVYQIYIPTFEPHTWKKCKPPDRNLILQGGKKGKLFFFGRAQTGESQLGIQKQVKKKVMQCRDDALQKKQQQPCYSEKKIPSTVPFWGSPQQIEFTRGFYVGCPSWHNTSIYPKLGLAQGCNHPIQLLSLIFGNMPLSF